jgi:hypothetical protein
MSTLRLVSAHERRLVVLAAGASTRLGTCKAWSTWRAHAARALVEAGAAIDGAPPLVVTGADHARIAAALHDMDLPPASRRLENPRWAEGRAGGVALAAQARRASTCASHRSTCRSCRPKCSSRWRRPGVGRRARARLARALRDARRVRQFGHPSSSGAIWSRGWPSPGKIFR